MNFACNKIQFIWIQIDIARTHLWKIEIFQGILRWTIRCWFAMSKQHTLGMSIVGIIQAKYAIGIVISMKEIKLFT